MPQHNQVPEGDANINGRLGMIEKGIEQIQKTLKEQGEILKAHCEKEDENANAIKALTKEVRENRNHADEQHASVMEAIHKLGDGK